MNDNEKTVLGGFTEAVSGIPEPIQRSFFKAAGALLEGLLALPAAKLNQLTQGINDKTAATTLTTEAISRAAAERLANEPDIVTAAAMVYMPTAVRKIRNRVKVAKNAANHLRETSLDTCPGNASEPDENWMNNFMRYAEDASSEYLQDLLGRLLAGKIVRPSMYSLATLRTLNELDTDLAKDFLHAWSMSVGESVDYSEVWKIGDGYLRWQRLIEAGLMATDSSRNNLPDFSPNNEGDSLWSPMQYDQVWLTIAFRKERTKGWSHIAFTRVGKEIGSLLPAPDYAGNMREAALRIDKQGLSWIRLWINDSKSELVWSSIR